MKIHVGADVNSGLAHTVTVTAAVQLSFCKYSEVMSSG